MRAHVAKIVAMTLVVMLARRLRVRGLLSLLSLDVLDVVVFHFDAGLLFECFCSLLEDDKKRWQEGS